jgi:hypothetical protein
MLASKLQFELKDSSAAADVTELIARIEFDRVIMNRPYNIIWKPFD